MFLIMGIFFSYHLPQVPLKTFSITHAKLSPAAEVLKL